MAITTGRYFLTTPIIYLLTMGELLVAAEIGKLHATTGQTLFEDAILASSTKVSVATVRSAIKKLAAGNHITSVAASSGKREVVFGDAWKQWLRNPIKRTARRDAQFEREVQQRWEQMGV
jgi:DNA-binding FadR family transcriptional regulator